MSGKPDDEDEFAAFDPKNHVPFWRCPKCHSLRVDHADPLALLCLDCGFGQRHERTPTDPRTLALWDMERPWKNPDYPKTTNEDVERLIQLRRKLQAQIDAERTWPEEKKPTGQTREERDRWRAERIARGSSDFPRSAELRAHILADPEDDGPRRRFAAWIRDQPPSRYLLREYEEHRWHTSKDDPAFAAWLIESQLWIAGELRKNPRFDLTARLPGQDGSFRVTTLRALSWDHYDLRALDSAGLIAKPLTYRGFVEHVAIKARWFLEIAEELYADAPIRQLTMTYCKDHLDDLVRSPHLDRIRMLSLPARMMDNKFTRLNDWTDEEVEKLAASPHLRGLRYLDFEDAPHLSERALVALARSPYLKELSHVSINTHHYHQTIEHPTWGGLGDYHRTVEERRVLSMRRAVEAEVGYVPWLHPEANYGALDPDLEAVIEHPVALDPAIAARRGSEVDPEAEEPSVGRRLEFPDELY